MASSAVPLSRSAVQPDQAFQCHAGRTGIAEQKIDVDEVADPVLLKARCRRDANDRVCARLSPGERTKIQRHILPLMEQVYRRTQLLKDELRAASITDVIDGMSIQHADRPGIDPEALSRAHRSACERIFS